MFFGRIGRCADVDYIANFKSASLDDLLTDWTAQIHRNAQIACEKFSWVRRGMLWYFLAILP
ncbi:Pycsar system effector family protein [Massilia atriviolacea]|uniref:Pycsar system effector family protein n=1 Tax=Massilia atriviolacea TaxID=2495579 RepID=UPI00351D640B